MIVTVDVDYSQFYLRRPGGWFDADETISLVNVDDKNGAVLFTVYQQYGALDLQVDVTDAEPAALGEEWADVVEVPLRAPAPHLLAGWDPSSTAHPLALVGDRDHRLRYAIDPSTVPARYLLQLWPAAPAPATLIRVESPTGQYWAFQSDAKAAQADAERLPTGERTRYMIRRGLAEHGETVQRIAAGDERYVSGILAYAQKIYPHEFSPDEQRELIIRLASSN